MAQAVDQLTHRRDALVRPGSLAEELAGRMGRTIPLVYGAHALGATAALRWKTQVNENAKSPAFSGVYPELCHNEIAGWGQHGDATRQLITVVNLRHDVEHPQVVRRVAFVAEAAPRVGGRRDRGEGRGRGRPCPAARPDPGGGLRVSPHGSPQRESTRGGCRCSTTSSGAWPRLERLHCPAAPPGGERITAMSNVADHRDADLSLAAFGRRARSSWPSTRCRG